MTRFNTPTRAVLRAATPALGIAVLAFACPAQAFTPSSKRGSESTPLNISSTTGSSHSTVGGPSLVRTIVGLLIVIAVIWGLAWILRQVKTGRARSSAGAGLTSMATLPLGSGTHAAPRARRARLPAARQRRARRRPDLPLHRAAGARDRPVRPRRGIDDGDPFATRARPRRRAPAASAGAGRGRPRAIQIPGQSRGAGAPAATSALVDRLREWTVRQ